MTAVNRRRLLHVFVITILVALDQFSKFWIRDYFRDGGEISIIPGVFRFSFVKNDGAVWGILSGKENSTLILTIITVLILCAVVFLYFRIPDTKHYLPLKVIIVFIISGAIGNLIDRIFYGYVTDFLDFELINFPVFNIADCYITVSMFVVLILVFTLYRKDDLEFFGFSGKKKEPENEAESKQEL